MNNKRKKKKKKKREGSSRTVQKALQREGWVAFFVGCGGTWPMGRVDDPSKGLFSFGKVICHVPQKLK
jgi:hypothetical protein